MMQRYRRPSKWILYLLYCVMVALLGGEAALPVARGWHEVIEIAVVGVTLGLMALWARRNRSAIDQEHLLREMERRSPERRDLPLTAVQARFLVAQRQYQQESQNGYHRHS